MKLGLYSALPCGLDLHRGETQQQSGYQRKPAAKCWPTGPNLQENRPSFAGGSRAEGLGYEARVRYEQISYCPTHEHTPGPLRPRFGTYLVGNSMTPKAERRAQRPRSTRAASSQASASARNFLRQPNSCCGLIPWLRGISDASTPGARLSVMIAILRRVQPIPPPLGPREDLDPLRTPDLSLIAKVNPYGQIDPAQVARPRLVSSRRGRWGRRSAYTSPVAASTATRASTFRMLTPTPAASSTGSDHSKVSNLGTCRAISAGAARRRAAR